MKTKMLFPSCTALVLAGCAVLTVDVDVYKGPLANEETIQVEQLGAMVMGVKPLLISLRDEAECNWNTAKVTAVRKEANSNRYEPKYMSRGFERDGQFFTNDIAMRVNAVLSLYEDRGPSYLIGEVEKSRRLLHLYENAFKTLRTTNSSTTRNNVKTNWSAPDADWATSVLDLVAPTNGWIDENKLFDLWVAKCTKKDGRNLATFQTTQAKWKELALPRTPNSPLPMTAKGFSGTPGRLELLASAPIAEDLSRELGLNGSQKANLHLALRDAAARFDNAHARLAELWTQSLNLFETVATSPEKDESVRRQQLEAIADFIGMAMSERRFVAAYHAGFSKSASLGIRRLNEAIGRLEPRLKLPDFGAPHTRQTKESDRLLVREAVKRALMANPLDFLSTLRMVSADIRNMTGEEFKATFEPGEDSGVMRMPMELILQVNRKYGLARSVPREPVDGEDVSSVERRLRQLNEGGSMGFAHGRVDSGLQQLIEKYLQTRAMASDPRQSSEVLAAREQMLQALVGFAEKIKFIADNQILATAGVSELGYSAKAKPYVLLLQATGNSILSLVDELRHREKRRRQEVDYAQVEQRAVTNAVSMLKETDHASAIRNKMLNAVTDSTNAVTTLDTLLQELRLMQVAFTAVGSNQMVTNIDLAIQLTRSYRAGQVHIRPPVAYLRSSYPASAVQDGTATAWRNELERQSGRGVPLFPDFHSHHRDGAKLQAEIDRQYWQNINNIRVAAAGKVNYVIVKDDIGNWYVKDFTANPTNINKAALALGLYAAGGQGANLLGQLGKAANPASDGSGESSKAVSPQLPPSGGGGNGNGPLLQQQKRMFDDEYAKQTKLDLDELEARLETLRTNAVSEALIKNEKVPNLWKETFGQNMRTNSIKMLNQERIIERLKQVNDLDQAVQKARKREESTETAFGDSDAEALRKHIREAMTAYLRRRLETVKQHENAMSVLSQSVGKTANQ